MYFMIKFVSWTNILVFINYKRDYLNLGFDLKNIKIGWLMTYLDIISFD